MSTLFLVLNLWSLEPLPSKNKFICYLRDFDWQCLAICIVVIDLFTVLCVCQSLCAYLTNEQTIKRTTGRIQKTGARINTTIVGGKKARQTGRGKKESPHLQENVNPLSVGVYLSLLYPLGIFINPTNARLQGSEFTLIDKPAGAPDDYFEPPLTSVSGANYFDRERATLFVVLRGSNPVDIIVMRVVKVTNIIPWERVHFRQRSHKKARWIGRQCLHHKVKRFWRLKCYYKSTTVAVWNHFLTS